MWVLAVWLIRASTANVVSHIHMSVSFLFLRQELGKRDLEQFCPDVSGTYNSTERDKVTRTYGGKQDLVRR